MQASVPIAGTVGVIGEAVNLDAAFGAFFPKGFGIPAARLPRRIVDQCYLHIARSEARAQRA
jgi:hypothetical protein